MLYKVPTYLKFWGPKGVRDLGALGQLAQLVGSSERFTLQKARRWAGFLLVWQELAAKSNGWLVPPPLHPLPHAGRVLSELNSFSVLYLDCDWWCISMCARFSCIATIHMVPTVQQYVPNYFCISYLIRRRAQEIGKRGEANWRATGHIGFSIQLWAVLPPGCYRLLMYVYTYICKSYRQSGAYYDYLLIVGTEH